MYTMSNIFEKINNSFFCGDRRTIKVKKNILYSFVIKGISIVISLLLVPLTIGYLNTFEYGVWLTLSSVLMWVNFFDIGLGNGLRNKLAEAIARGDVELGKIYVSTTFFMLLILMSSLFLIFVFFQNWINWSDILNIKTSLIPNLNGLVTIVFGLFCVNIVLKFIGNVYLANQKPAMNDLIALLGNVLSLILIYFLTLFYKGSLQKVAIVYSASPVVILMLFYPIVFYKQYSSFRPSIKSIKLKYFKDLIGLGVQFFFMQVGGMLIFATSNIIISQYLNPAEVTSYNIAFKYFSIVSMAFTIIITPMWTASTDAYVRGDIDWIKKSMNKILKIWLLCVVITFVMILFANDVYTLWVGSSIRIPFNLSFMTGMYVLIYTWSMAFSTLIFGIGKIRIQLYNTLIVGFLFIPLSVLLCDKYGIVGVMTALCIVNASGAILNPVQFVKLVSGKAINIWNK